MMAIWIILSHSLALFSLALIGAPGLLSATLFAAVLASLYRSILLHARRSHPAAICRLVWKDGEECVLTWSSGKQLTARMQARAFVMPWLVALHLKDSDGKSFRLALLPDMLDREVFRRLRVRLIIELQQCGAEMS